MTKKTPASGAFFADSETKGTSVSYDAKIGNPQQKAKDLLRVLQYFHYKVGTSLDCALSTGILRNSITWYICDLERLGLLQAIKKAKDKTTGFRAKYYSADQTLWRKQTFTQLNIWDGLS